MQTSENSEPILRLVVEHQDRIYRYVYSLCPWGDVAQDVLQDACVALLRNAHKYDPERPFLPWAYRFAQLEVLKHRERTAKTKRAFDADVIELLSRQRQLLDDELHSRLFRLEKCLATLSENDRRTIDGRYKENLAADELAAWLGVSRRTLFRNLQRIRGVLMECIAGLSQETAV